MPEVFKHPGACTFEPAYTDSMTYRVSYIVGGLVFAYVLGKLIQKKKKKKKK